MLPFNFDLKLHKVFIVPLNESVFPMTLFKIIKKGRITFMFWMILLSFKALSQNICSLTDSELNTYLCINNYVTYKDNISASEVVNNILDKLKIKNITRILIYK